MSAGVSSASRTLLVLASHRAGACLSTHDAAPHAFWYIWAGLIGHMAREVDQVVKVRERHVLELVDITLEL